MGDDASLDAVMMWVSLGTMRLVGAKRPVAMKFADEPVGYYLERSLGVGAVGGRVVLENLM